MLYLVGLILVIVYILMGIDDMIWDIITLIKRQKKKDNILEINKIDSKPPKLIAIVIAAWKEDNVLKEVIDNIITSQHYPKSMYHIFLGVYPNDDSTVRVARYLEEKYSNVHCVINAKEGPTSKAQNINHVIEQIRGFEKKLEWRFTAITVHDSEDIVHPYELRATNYIIDEYKAVQYPVFPLIKKPTLFNYFSNITTNTYADEFAENHYITMVSRYNVKAFVPSAGTGFAVHREVIDKLGYYVLPEESLTEDYRLALALYEQGIKMHYVLEKLQRVDAKGKIKKEFIATRSMFPNTFKTAVRQKTRWTLGITMQSHRFVDIFKKKMSFAGKYSLYRDQKAKISNLIAGIAYPVFVYFVISLFTDLPEIYPIYSLSWYLSLVVTVMMLERQIFRAVALYKVYGWLSVFWGCLFPPLMPLRIVWGNTINFVATIRAYGQFFKGKRKAMEKAEEKIEEIKEETKEEISVQEVVVDWNKTEHSFLEVGVLKRFHRKFGDIAVAKGYITAKDLKRILKSKDHEEFIGKQLVAEEKITEEQLIDIITDLENVPYVKDNSLEYYNLKQFKDNVSREFLEEHRMLPLMKTKGEYVFAVSYKIDKEILEQTQEGSKVSVVLAKDETIQRGIRMMFDEEISGEYEYKNLANEQKVLIKNYASNLSEREDVVAKEMGFYGVKSLKKEFQKSI